MSNATHPRGAEALSRAWESVAAPPRDPERREQLHALVQRLLDRSEDNALEGVLLGYLLGVDERWREPASARHEAPPEAQHLDDEGAVLALYDGIDVIAELDTRVSPRAARRLRYLVYSASPNRAEIWRWVEEERPELAAITKPANAQDVVEGILLAVQEGVILERA